MLGHAQISRKHMRLYIQASRVYVEDLGSSNGTRLNEERIDANTPKQLAVGDNVSLGPFVLTLLEIVTPAAPPPPPPPPIPEAEPEPEPPKAVEPEPEPPVRAEAPPEPAPEPEPPAPTRRKRQQEPEPEPEPPPLKERLEVEIPSLEQRREAFMLVERGERSISRVDGYDSLGYLVGVPRPPDKSTWMQYLPAIYEEDDFLGRFLLICESLFSPIVWMVDNFDLYLSPEVAPPEWLMWMASWFDLLLRPELPEARMRSIMDQIGWLFLRRGTRIGLERLLQLYFGVRPEIIESSDSCHFTVRLRLRDSDVKLSQDVIERLIASQKPAFAAFTLEIS
ncbi:MAG: FHA domain-containing protein [Anaerolineae bacterium]|nr:FHA domain-containing protein [Anaerolineae bacterium]